MIMETIKIERAKLIGTVVEYDKKNEDIANIHFIVEAFGKRFDISIQTSKETLRVEPKDFVKLLLYMEFHLKRLRNALGSIADRFYPDCVLTDDVIKDVKGNLKDLYTAILERTDDFKFEPNQK